MVNEITIPRLSPKESESLFDGNFRSLEPKQIEWKREVERSTEKEEEEFDGRG